MPSKYISPKVVIVMGSQSDYKTMKLCEKVLKILKVKFETKIVSAHRTPKRMFQFAINAEKNNVSLIIAAAGGSAHLPGMISALTYVPVLGVPVESKKLKGLDSLLSIASLFLRARLSLIPDNFNLLSKGVNSGIGFFIIYITF